ncbi:hypothetical protein [Caldimonas brevitalea]|uniref:Uncharacterized protein n=1 Tax=Caldimonas brevitalea TaxID=413882 RepID=A0A0G3BL31_9BURK|nr:hypothetical protein [Caldimonas brevitalea]AKJ28076.1 hypothetical protein AAW51_1385 [Caldimonas brevitalea]
MLPLPDVIEYSPEELPTEFGGSAFAALRAPCAETAPGPIVEVLQPSHAAVLPSSDLLLLARFKELMAAHGWPVQIARMMFDRVYAFERIALARICQDDTLQAMALELFKSCEREQQRRLLDAH